MAAATPEQMATWPAPNYDDPESLGGLVVGLTASSLVLVVIFMTIRLYSKGVLRQTLGLDDLIMFAAAIISIPVSALALHSLSYGLGLHIWDQRKEWHASYNKMGFVADILFPIVCSSTKISLCLTYLRLFPSRTDRLFCYVIIIFLTLYTVTCLGLMLFQCTPVRGYWDDSVESRCINMRVTLITIASLNSIGDFLVYLWPAKPLWSLQLPLEQRLGLVLLFSVGAVVCVAGVVRMYFLEQYFTSYDLLWNAAKVYPFMILEMSLGIVCGCLTSVKALLAILFPRFFTTPSHRTHIHSTYANSTNANSRRLGRPKFIPTVNKPADTKTDDVGVAVGGAATNLVRFSPNHGQSFAWVGSHGVDDEERGAQDIEVPFGAIKVQTMVVMKEEGFELARIQTGRSDSGSEDWIIASGESLEPAER